MSTSIQPNAPFRADIVGSFLRPQAVKDARAAYTAGTLDAEGLKAVEDDAIRDLVARQKAAGLQVITDGEFRRSYWHLDFMWGLNGVERRTSRTGYMFHDEETTADTAVVTGPISGENHPFVEHFKFVKALEGRVRSRDRPFRRRSRRSPKSRSTAAMASRRACAPSTRPTKISPMPSPQHTAPLLPTCMPQAAATFNLMTAPGASIAMPTLCPRPV